MTGRANGLGGRGALVRVLDNMARTRMVETSQTSKSMTYPYKSAMEEF
ncbi:hypothetical protein TIFTF001_023970 [Ficus carica]|uniref:Uncharacterized protein n=1 Tax=Ficus carica TaxID=3494 RepID=A0AA88DEA8_FICCA|nr:hypothetical protein TIFTF001_023970 [Ficus carica]